MPRRPRPSITLSYAMSQGRHARTATLSHAPSYDIASGRQPCSRIAEGASPTDDVENVREDRTDCAAAPRKTPRSRFSKFFPSSSSAAARASSSHRRAESTPLSPRTGAAGAGAVQERETVVRPSMDLSSPQAALARALMSAAGAGAGAGGPPIVRKHTLKNVLENPSTKNSQGHTEQESLRSAVKPHPPPPRTASRSAASRPIPPPPPQRRSSRPLRAPPSPYLSDTKTVAGVSGILSPLRNVTRANRRAPTGRDSMFLQNQIDVSNSASDLPLTHAAGARRVLPPMRTLSMTSAGRGSGLRPSHTIAGSGVKPYPPPPPMLSVPSPALSMPRPSTVRFCYCGLI